MKSLFKPKAREINVEEDGYKSYAKYMASGVFVSQKRHKPFMRAYAPGGRNKDKMKQNNPNSNKGGRPQKEERRLKRITIRLTTTEHFVIRQKAEKAKIPIAEYLRKCGIHSTIKVRLSDEDRHFFRQLTGISNNINQMAKLAHQEGLLSAFAHFKNELTIIDKLIKKFKDDK